MNPLLERRDYMPKGKDQLEQNAESMKLPKKLQDEFKRRALKLEYATTSEEHYEGLQFRSSIPDDYGMFFIFDKPQKVSFHMQNVKFPLNMEFFDKDGTMIKKMNAQPETEGYDCDNVQYVLETKCETKSAQQDYSIQKEIANRIADSLVTKIQGFEKDAGKLFPEGWTITFIKKHSPNGYSVSVDTNPEQNNRIYLNFYEQKEISSESLADPTKNYETTSGRIVKFKKRKLRNYYENEQKAMKVIDKFFSTKTAQRGMPEDVQHSRLKGLEQVEIVDSVDRDWIDQEAELQYYGMDDKNNRDLLVKEILKADPVTKQIIGPEPSKSERTDENAWWGIEEEKKDQMLGTDERDNTEKYILPDQKLYNQRYWTEKRMTNIIDQVLKEARIKRASKWIS